MTNEGRNELSGSTVVWIRNKQLEVRLCKPGFLKLGWQGPFSVGKPNVCICVYQRCPELFYQRETVHKRTTWDVFHRANCQTQTLNWTLGRGCLLSVTVSRLVWGCPLLAHASEPSMPFVLFLRFLRPSDVFSRDRSYALVSSHHIVQPVLWLLKRSLTWCFQ